MKKIVTIVVSAVAMIGISLMPMLPVAAVAVDCSGMTNQTGCGVCAADPQATAWDDATKTCTTGSAGQGNLSNLIQIVINVMLFIVGTLSVIMIIFGGIRYTASAGNKSAIDSAKTTIIYAVVGLVVAIIAFALVQWVFSSLVK
jgi:hypothetical protein